MSIKGEFVTQEKTYIIAILLLLCMQFTYAERSIHRPVDPLAPEIITAWENGPDKKEYSLKSPFLEEWAIFGRFDKNFLLSQQLPEQISYRYDPTTAIPRTDLENIIEKFVAEVLTVKQKHHEFENFTILKDVDFNYKHHSGVIIAKFKKYPFVLKLFRETPKMFTQPFSKGLQPGFFFVMGGGINRYLAGFTRISNLHALNKQIAIDPYWANRLTTPRKWFWLPKNGNWFRVTGKNIGNKKEQSILYPSIYGIICDAIDIERTFSINKKSDRKLAMNLARFIGNKIDPHIDNFIVEKHTEKIAFIDTEHFASMVGLRKPLEFNHYASWYSRLGNKCLKDTSFRSKRERKALQQQPTPEILLL
jgi:hypothetical protein